jgi:hypothetical protein
LPKVALSPVVIFGLSTEGYRMASSLSSFDLQTTLVDENLNVGMQLKKEILSRFDSIAALLEDEPLLGLEPMEDAIGKARCLFFAPKIREQNMEVGPIISSKLKSVLKNISKGVVFVNMLPTGYGGNKANISFIEKLTGLEVGVGFDYIYAPLISGTNKPIVIGSSRTDIEKVTMGILKSALMDVPKVLPLHMAETIYSRHIIRKYNALVTDFELCKSLKLGEGDFMGFTEDRQEIYLEDMAENLLDIRVISEALKTGEPMWYTLSGIMKSLESYFKHVINGFRSIIKDEGLKASRTRILVAWSVDPFEVRGGKIATLSKLIDKLRDCVGDIITFNTVPYLQALRPELSVERNLPLSPDKNNIVLACSKKDFELVFKNTRTERSEMRPIIIKANLLLDVV